MNGKTTFIYWLVGIVLVLVGSLWALTLQANEIKHAELDNRTAHLEDIASKNQKNIALICQALDVRGCQP